MVPSRRATRVLLLDCDRAQARSWTPRTRLRRFAACSYATAVVRGSCSASRDARGRQHALAAGLGGRRTGQRLNVLRGHTGTVWSVALSADGRLVVSGGFDGTVKVWDAQTGATLRTVQAERRYERVDITRLTGVTDAQRQSLVALRAVDRSR